MSNAIRFLETLGSNPDLSRLSPDQLEAMIAELGVDDLQKQALLAGDAEALNEVLGGKEKMMCLIWTPSEQPEGDEPDSVPAEEPAPEQSPEEE